MSKLQTQFIQLHTELPGPIAREIMARKEANVPHNVIRVLSPLVITDGQLEEGLQVLEGVLT